ncbi:MAG TPA: hypothetical protein GXZ86_09245 [Clostridiales bacterium]|jgi:hypothetical protein|nr:hypothetical protein [Clostridiales bacterium]
MIKLLKWLLLLACIVFLPMATFGQADQIFDSVDKKSLEMIRAMNDNRDIRSSKTLNMDNTERVYYVATEGEEDVFCIQSRHNNGAWERDIETSALLPKNNTGIPIIEYDSDQRVYITYYPDDKLSLSVFTYAYTLVYEAPIWYVESVSFGKLNENSQIFKATIINLATGTNSTYSFNTKTEEIIDSKEIASNHKKIRVSEFVLSDFMNKIGFNDKSLEEITGD